jgi:N-acetylglucosaminyldiphosphoundecaprenol N-acetyl-beta-D-mannosaminyltransferase
VHPRTRGNLEKFGLDLGPNVVLTKPQSYMEFLNLWKDASLMLTDSGGLQEETTALGVPCITLRENTERPVTVDEGSNVLVGTDPARILEEAAKVLAGQGKQGRRPALWDGKAAERSGKPHQHVVVNVDKLVKASRDEELRRIINECALINVDGMPVVWASRMLGKGLKERVAGVDLFEALMKRAAEKGWRVFLLGAKEDVVSGVKTLYEKKYSGLTVAGYRNGYWKPEEEAGVVEKIKEARADLLFVAISSPKKEHFLGRYQAEMKIPFAMGVGGTFDVAVGKVKRAPVWMQKAGLEWFYRFLQEPRRMFKRYFVDDMAFFWLLAKEAARR